MASPTQNFSKVVLDLSGRGGLVDRFFGDYPYDSTNPRLSIYAGDTQYATGTVNPIAKYGYLSPANNTFTTVVASSSAVLAATIVDEINSFAFLYGFDGVLRRTTALTDTSITATTVSVASTNGIDLEFYTVQGISQFLFFAYKTSTAAKIGVWNTTGITSTNVNGTTLFLEYDTQTAAFHVGDLLTGGTSGATGHISVDSDRGATGCLLLTTVSGTFVDAETITDPDGGSAKTHITGGIFSSVATDFFNSSSHGPASPITFGHNNLRMIVADNGYMYILDGSAVHKYDGTANAGTTAAAFGTVTSNVLLFPPIYQLTDGLDMRGRIWMTLVRTTRDIIGGATNTAIFNNYCGVYVWDRSTTGTSTEDFIEVPGTREIRSIYSFQGVPTLFTVSATRYTQIRMWDGSGFGVAKELGPEAYPRFHDSVSIQGDMMVWQGNDGKFYYYGKLVPSASNSLYAPGDVSVTISSGTLSENGAILLSGGGLSASSGDNTTSESYYCSMKDTGGTAKVLKWFPHNLDVATTSQQAHAGTFKTAVKILPKLSHVHFITLFWPPTGSGGATTVMNVDFYFNQSSTAWSASSIAITQDDALRGYKTISVQVPNVNMVQLGITYPSSTSISAIPTPSYATIEYNPTSKII